MTYNYIYDYYEISGCYRFNDDGARDPNGSYVERCDDEAQAQFWTIYGHIDGQGVEAIGDFASRKAAEAVYLRIVGEPFTGSYEAGARLRLMHAAPALLAACELVVDRWERGDLAEAVRLCAVAITGATRACTPWVSAEPDIRSYQARKHQIAVVWSIEDVQSIRAELNDQQAWEVLNAANRHHDATIGINWDVLACHAEILFGMPPDSGVDEED